MTGIGCSRGCSVMLSVLIKVHCEDLLWVVIKKKKKYNNNYCRGKFGWSHSEATNKRQTQDHRIMSELSQGGRRKR